MAKKVGWKVQACAVEMGRDLLLGLKSCPAGSSGGVRGVCLTVGLRSREHLKYGQDMRGRLGTVASPQGAYQTSLILLLSYPNSTWVPSYLGSVQAAGL